MKQQDLFSTLKSKKLAQPAGLEKPVKSTDSIRLVKSLKTFGGSLLKGRRKSERPLSFKKPLHLVLRSHKTNSKIYFSPKDRRLHEIIHRAARRYHVRIYKFALNWNHLHFAILVSSRKDYVSFVRYLPAQMVRYFSHKNKTKIKGLFSLRPFSRIVSWGRDFATLCKYINLNIVESAGCLEELHLLADHLWRAGPLKDLGP